MVKLRDLIVNAMSEEDKAKVADRTPKAMTDDEVAALPEKLNWLKNAKKGGNILAACNKMIYNKINKILTTKN